MRDLLVATIVFGALPFVLRRPFLGILLMAWLGYMNPHRLCYGFILSFPVVQIVAIFTLLGMMMIREPKRMVWGVEIVLIIVLVSMKGISTLLGFYPEAAQNDLIRFVKIQILTFMTLMLLTSPQRVTLLIWAIVVSLGFYGLKGGLFTLAHGGVYRVEGPFGTFIGGNNELALAMVMTIPLARYLYQQESSKLVRLGLLMLMCLLAIAAIGTQSRGALVALSITGFVFWWKGKNKILSGILIAAAAAFILSFMPDSWFERMNTIKTYEQDASAMGRINAWWVAFRVANEHMFGGGAGMWTPAIFQRHAPVPNDVHDVHSIYFEVLGEQGWPGLVVFVLLLVTTWFKCWSIQRMAKKHPDTTWARDLALMIQVSLVGYMSAGTFLGLAYFDYLYHLIAVVVVTHMLVKQARREQQPSDAPKLDLFTSLRGLMARPQRRSSTFGLPSPHR